MRYLLTVCALLVHIYPAFSQMVRLPEGQFRMGSENGEADESPAHRLTLSSFRIDIYEVSVAQYDSCVKHGACTPAHYTDGTCLLWNGAVFKRIVVPSAYRTADVPVVCVTWQQARRYCRFQGKKLPTEAQWEYAACGGKTATYAWGTTLPTKRKCAYAGEHKPKPCGSYPPGPAGLYDMTGNVWEWTNDRYQQDFYVQSQSTDPPGPVAGRYRVIRGGGWYSDPAQLRIQNRHWFSPTHAEASIGFRCVRD
ncbi:MAG: SUMF1/EgtB/PvdO family nonheme iron enzyme [Chitinivibrionales bacterium]|nr:SUMF1/EgtB/PvdO family nonheme iron enzyme [Chitinivibrionales bacterium]